MSIQESHVKSLEVFRKYEMNMLEGLRTRYWRRNYDTRAEISFNLFKTKHSRLSANDTWI